MCRNHSHLIARFVGEDTQGQVPALMFELEKRELRIEAPGQTGMNLTVPISGMLIVPSLLLAGYAHSLQLVTEVPPMSLFLLPAGDSTITPILPPVWTPSAWLSAATLLNVAFCPILGSNGSDERETTPF